MADGRLSESSGKGAQGYLYPLRHQAANADGSPFAGGCLLLFFFPEVVNGYGMALSGDYGIFGRFFHKDVQKRSCGRFDLTGGGPGTSYCVCVGESFQYVSQGKIVIAGFFGKETNSCLIVICYSTALASFGTPNKRWDACDERNR